MKRILTSFALVAASVAFSQVSISGNTNDTPQATLDIKAIGGTATADGVLIPRVNRQRAQNMQNVKHSTLVYVDDITNGAQSGQANQIDAKGFYYFDTEVGSGEWVKLGAASRSSSEITLSSVKGVIQYISVPITKESINANTFTIIATQGGLRSVELPDPAGDNNGRVLSINNQSGSDITFAGSWQPEGMTKLSGGAGHLLISDGTNWYVIGGLY